MRWCLRLPPLFALALGLVGARAAEVMPPAPANHFNDYAGVVSAGTAQAIESELTQFERATSDQIIVAVFPRMQSDSSIEDYTLRVAQSWGGWQTGRNNGAVLFVFVQEHKVYIQVGYGLEGALPDALTKQIIENEIVPRFRQGDYDGGLRAGVSAMLAATRGEYRGNGRLDREHGGGGGFPFQLLFPLGLIIIVSVLRSRQQVVYRGSGHRTLLGGGPWIFPGGGFGGGGFGGGGGGGSFSGGGGGFGFGGGGSGGSW